MSSNPGRRRVQGFCGDPWPEENNLRYAQIFQVPVNKDTKCGPADDATDVKHGGEESALDLEIVHEH